MKQPAPSKGSVCCLFSVFHGLVVKLHETNPVFLSETLEKPTGERCLKTVLHWFGTTTNKVARTMAEFLQDARFQCLKPESLDIFFKKFQSTCLSIFFIDKNPSRLETLGRFLFWSCLDTSCHDSIVESFESMKNARWAYEQGAASASDKLKWWLLRCGQYSIENSTTTIFKNIQHEMELVAQQPAQEVTLTKLLVRLLIAKDIIPRSMQFYTQIGPNCGRFSGLNMSGGGETENMSLAVTNNFVEHIRVKNPRPRETAMEKIKKICKGEDHAGCMSTGVDIGTYAESIGFKNISGKGVGENQEHESTSKTGSDPAPATPGKRGTSETGSDPAPGTKKKKNKKKMTSTATNQEHKSTSETGSDPAPGTPGKKGAKVGMALPLTITDTARSKEISGKHVKEAPSAADEPTPKKKNKKKTVSTVILPRGVSPGLGYLIKELTKGVPDDFRVTVPVSALPEGLLPDHGHVEDADGLRLLIAFLMIVKNSFDSTGGKVLRRILSEELAGVNVRSVPTVLSHLRTTPLFKSEFIQQVLNQDLKELSGSVVVWSTCFKTEVLLEEGKGKGKDTATPATAPRRDKARTTATADTETSETKKSVKRKKPATRGDTGDTTRKRKTKPGKPDRGKAGC